MRNQPQTHDHETLLQFIGPSWTTDWCPRCGWLGACADCRSGWMT